MKSNTLPAFVLQPIFPGLDTLEDMIFWRHYNENLSNLLTVEGETNNGFTDIIVPIAVNHQGLMHSILSLASKHIDFDTPYGLRILQDHPTTSLEALRERSLYHSELARVKFHQKKNQSLERADDIATTASLGQMLCFLLETLVEGNPHGDHRVHLRGYRNLMNYFKPVDTPFFAFIAEFFEYHIFADELLHSGPDQLPPLKVPLPLPDRQRLLGVVDGLFEYFSEISRIRNTIKSNMIAQIDPAVTYASLYRASEIDLAVREWSPNVSTSDCRIRVATLYKKMVWIYLVRTIYPPSSSSASSSMASSVSSLSFIHSSPVHARSVSSVVNTPPHSASTSCASSPKPTLGWPNPSPGSSSHNGRQSNPQANPPSRKNSTAGTLTLANNSIQAACSAIRLESPPPIRRPPHNEHDTRIIHNVDEALEILETFKPSDPSQTLLLLPCFVVGTACFVPAQQDKIRTAIKNYKGYSGLRNADLVMTVLEELWRLMAAGKWSAVWDWPGVAQSLGLDFIPA